MKRVLFAGLLLLAFSTASFSKEIVASGKTHTTVGDYKIEVADQPLTVNGEELKTFVISYQNSPLKVTVAVKKDKDCKNYFVLSEKLSVQYVCTDDYFGIQKLDKSLDIAGFSNSDEALDRSQYFRQKLLVPGKSSEIESTQLIAAYFPLLIKGESLAAM
jgi:hypothetical protein